MRDKLNLAICLLLSSSVLFSSSCNKDKTINNYSSKKTPALSREFINTPMSNDDIGNDHNVILNYVDNNLYLVNNDYNSTESIAHTLSDNYVTNNPSLNIDEATFDQGFEQFRNVYSFNTFMSTDWTSWAKTYTGTLISNNVIGSTEGDMIVSIFSFLQNCRTNNITDQTQIKKGLDEIATQYANTKWDENQGVLAGWAISVAQHSCAFWTGKFGTYPYTNSNPPINAFVNVVAGDVGGLIAGAGGSILSNVFHGNSIDWKDAAAWGIAGAVGGSCVGPIARILTWAFA